MQNAEHVFRLLDREVWAVTAGTLDDPGALLATWVMQATLDPQRPVLMAGIAPNHHTAARIDESGQLAAHLLRPDQIQFALRLATASGYDVDKLAGVKLQPAGEGLAPVLADCLAWVAGPVFARLDAGDRVFYWIEVQAAQHQDGQPLRQSQLIAAADDRQKQIVRDDRDRDIKLHRPLHQQWRQNLPDLFGC